MLRALQWHTTNLAKSWCATATIVRNSASGPPQLVPIENPSPEQPAEVPKFRESPSDSSDSLENGKQSSWQKGPFLHISMYKSLIEDHAVPKQSLRHLLYFIKTSKHLGYTAPKNISVEDMLTLYGKPSITKRLRFLRYLREREERAHRKLHPKQPKTYEQPRPRSVIAPDAMDEYGLFRNSILTRIRPAPMYSFYEQRLVANMPFTPKVALDFGYNDMMNERETNKAMKDVIQLYSYNRRAEEPFNLTFCGFPDLENEASVEDVSPFIERLYNTLIRARGIPFPCEYTAQSITDVFPREKLVYLSPEGEEVLETIDEDSVYVLGVLVDKEHQPGLSAQRARDLGIRSARFPGRIRLHWEDVEKPMHIVHCLQVMHLVRKGRDWEEAISRVNKNLSVEFEADEVDDCEDIPMLA